MKTAKLQYRVLFFYLKDNGFEFILTQCEALLTCYDKISMDRNFTEFLIEIRLNSDGTRKEKKLFDLLN